MMVVLVTRTVAAGGGSSAAVEARAAWAQRPQGFSQNGTMNDQCELDE